MNLFADIKISSINKAVKLGVGWAALTVSYLFSLQHNFFIHEWSYLIYLLQLIFDILIGTFSYCAYIRRVDEVGRRFYLLIFLSLIPGLFTNELYNLFVTLIELSQTGLKASLYWTFSYTLFLMLQFAAWIYLIIKNSEKPKLNNKTRFLNLPYLHSSLIIFVSLIAVLILKGFVLQPEEIAKIFNSCLEVLVFTLMSVCLSRTKNKSLVMVEIGFLLLIGFNFTHRFSDFTEYYYKIYNVAWFLCLIVIVHGLLESVRSANKRIIFHNETSIHVLCGSAFIFFANIILILFILTALGFSSIQFSKLASLEVLIQNIPSALVFSYTITLFIAKFLSGYLSRPLENMVDKINQMSKKNNGAPDDTTDEVYNIYEVKQTEDVMISTIQKLQQANHVKSQFLTSMSHDFRTPASGIMYMSKAIHDRIENIELKKLQKMVVNSSEQLMSFIEEVLDYSKIDNDFLELNNQVFDIVKLINDLISFVGAKIHENGLKLIFEYEQVQLIYCGDRILIHRVLLNIISNAIKFTDHGYIQIFVSTCYIDTLKHIVISVTDTGIGIPAEKQKLIFEPFYRAASSDLARYSGIGLGLSNADLMVRKMGGKIEILSEICVGSEFKIFLPCKDDFLK